jgi:hypothetical protein
MLLTKLEGSVMVYYNSVMHKINRDFLDRIIPCNVQFKKPSRTSFWEN